MQAGRLDRADLPNAVAFEFDAQDRAGKGFEHLAGKIFQRRIRRLAEVHQHAQIGGVAAAGRQELAELAAQVLDVEAVQRAPAQVVDGAH